MHLLTKGTPFNDLSEGCAFRIKIGHYFQENFGARNISPLNFRPKSLGGHRPPFLLCKNHDFGHVLLLRYICFWKIFLGTLLQRRSAAPNKARLRSSFVFCLSHRRNLFGNYITGANWVDSWQFQLTVVERLRPFKISLVGFVIYANAAFFQRNGLKCRQKRNNFKTVGKADTLY